MRGLQRLSPLFRHVCHAQRNSITFDHIGAWQTVRGIASLSGAEKNKFDWSYVGSLTLAGFAAALYRLYADESHCAADLPLVDANPKGDQFVSQFKEWLKDTKCDTAAIAIAPSIQVSVPF